MERLSAHIGDTFLETFVKVDVDGDELDLNLYTIEFEVFRHADQENYFKVSTDPESEDYDIKNIKASNVDGSIFLLFMDAEFTETLEPDLYYYRLKLLGPNNYKETFNIGTLTLYN